MKNHRWCGSNAEFTGSTREEFPNCHEQHNPSWDPALGGERYHCHHHGDDRGRDDYDHGGDDGDDQTVQLFLGHCSRR